MTFVKGATNQRTVELRKNQEKVLGYIAEGASIANAMKAIGNNAATIRVWANRDKKFAEALEVAKQSQGKNSLAALGVDKENLSFEEFSRVFMGQRVFPHQQTWIDVIEGRPPTLQHPSITFEPANPNRILLNVPPEHAKSTTLTVNYPTYRIALNPNVRVIIVSKTLVKAREFVYAIKGRLSHPRYLKMQEAFGPDGGWKEDADTWRTDTVYLGSDARNSSEKDPTVQALGMGGQIYGARADLIILDDCITTTNAHEFDKQINWIQKEVITRLGKNGKLIVVGTRIAAQDLYRELREPKYWSSGASPFSYMGMPAVLEYAEKKEDWLTLWSRSDVPWEGDEDTEPGEDGLYPKWDGPTLFARRGEVTPHTWALVYQQENVHSEAHFPADLLMGATNGRRRVGPLKAGAVGHPEKIEGYTIIGLDPAMVGNAAFVALNFNRADGKMYVLDCINMSEPTPQKIRSVMEDWVKKYRPNEFRIEINAYQKAFALDDDLRAWLSGYGVRLTEHFTGKNKWDADYGVASMATLFGTMREGKFQNNNLIEFPSSENSEGIKSLVQQLIVWYPKTRGKTDCVMALWFCVLRAREMIQQGTRITPYTNNKWATRQQMSHRTTVNLDKLQAELSGAMYS